MPCIHLAALSWNLVLIRVSIAVRTTMTISNLGGKDLFCYTCTYSLHKGSPGRNLEAGQRLWRGALLVSSLSQSDSYDTRTTSGVGAVLYLHEMM